MLDPQSPLVYVLAASWAQPVLVSIPAALVFACQGRALAKWASHPTSSKSSGWSGISSYVMAAGGGHERIGGGHATDALWRQWGPVVCAVRAKELGQEAK